MKYPKLHIFLGGSMKYIRVNHLSNYLLKTLLVHPYVPLEGKKGLHRIPNKVIEAMEYVEMMRRL